MRIKNEARWIKRVIESTYPLCERIFVMDDHSTDDTLEICRGLDERVHVYESPFPEHDLDESRDKNWLYDKVFDYYPPRISKDKLELVWPDGFRCRADSGIGREIKWPDWILCLDGDEELTPDTPEIIRRTCESTSKNALSLRILYLWNVPDQIRVDGVYRDYRRPSLFRCSNPAFRFQTTPWGGNLHCASIPQAFLHEHGRCEGKILHYGYMLPEDRERKYRWYNTIDPNNKGEDEYIHMIIGDTINGLNNEPIHIPANYEGEHGGPLKLEAL
jgi:glycosyltransferase involved in cell wall biosynthesis